MPSSLLQGSVGASLLVVLLALPLAGQIQPVEFSVDGGLEFTLNDVEDDRIAFTLPFQLVRVGAGIGSRTSVEGALRFRLASEGHTDATEVLFMPALTFHFRPYEQGSSRAYVSGLGAISHVDMEPGDLSAGDTRFGVGVRGGVKIPFARAGFVRLETGLTHFLEGDILSEQTVLDLTVGLGAVVN